MRKGVIIQSPALCTMPPVPTSVNIQSSAQEDKQSAPRLHRRGGATAWMVYVQPGPLPAAQDGAAQDGLSFFLPPRTSYDGRRRGRRCTWALELGTPAIHHPSNSIEAG